MRAVDEVAESPSVFDFVEITVTSTARRPGNGSGNVTCSLGTERAQGQSFGHAAVGGYPKQPVDVGEHDAVVTPGADGAGGGVRQANHRPASDGDLVDAVERAGNPFAVR